MTDLEVRAIAEAVADLLVERGLVATSAGGGGRVLDALAVAELLGRERQWVYDHADELGGFRYGDGPRARIGFDLNTVERWKRERRRSKPTQVPKRTAPASRVALIPYEGSGRGA